MAVLTAIQTRIFIKHMDFQTSVRYKVTQLWSCGGLYEVNNSEIVHISEGILGMVLLI
jgi:hypothetical protein